MIATGPACLPDPEKEWNIGRNTFVCYSDLSSPAMESEHTPLLLQLVLSILLTSYSSIHWLDGSFALPRVTEMPEPIVCNNASTCIIYASYDKTLSTTIKIGVLSMGSDGLSCLT